MGASDAPKSRDTVYLCDGFSPTNALLYIQFVPPYYQTGGLFFIIFIKFINTQWGMGYSSHATEAAK